MNLELDIERVKVRLQVPCRQEFEHDDSEHQGTHVVQGDRG